MTSFADIGKKEALRRLYEGSPYKQTEPAAHKVLLEGVDFNLVYFPLKHLGYKAVMEVTGELYAQLRHPGTLSVVLGVSAKLDYPQIEEEHGDLTDEEIHALIKKAVDAANDQMPPYKRVQRIGIRKTEFEKTTTRKIKRHNQANFSGEEEEDI